MEQYLYPQEAVDVLLEKIKKLERENQELKGTRPEDGAFKPCGNKDCPNKVQVGTRYCPPCRGGR